jgi:signal transduction histidine kinase
MLTQTTGASPAGEHGRLLLLIEDNPGDADLVCGLLEHTAPGSYRIHHCSSMALALAALREQRAEVVLLDLHLPDVDGVEAVKVLRQQAEAAIVVLTGTEDDQLARACLDAGAQDYLLKNEIHSRHLLPRSIEFALERRKAMLQQEQLERLVGEAPTGIVVVDAEGIVQLANQAALDLFGRRREELEGSPLALPIHEEQLSEIEVPRADGMRRAEIRSVPFDWKGVPGFLVLATDITEKRRLESQLQQSQKMQAVGQLAGGVAHDFNNLLCVITGYCELLTEELALDAVARSRVDQIWKAAGRAADLTRQLLAFGRKQVLQPRVLDLGEVVQELAKMLRRLIGENIEVITKTAPKLSRVMADPGQIEQVILNLAVNARDAMPKGGRLILETRNVVLEESSVWERPGVTPGSYVLLAVADTGCGMDAATLGQVFEPFYTTKEPGKGTGLGLSMVHGIVNQSGGHIAVYSEPNLGTTFRVYLPAIDGEVEPPGASVPQASLRGHETILVLEDAEALREILCEMLRASGYHVLAGGTQQEALRCAAEHAGPIDLALSDVVMAGASGPEVVAQIQAARPEMRVIFMSGYTDEAIGHHFVIDSGIHFLQKPFPGRVLRQKVREVLDAPPHAPGKIVDA